MAAVGDLELTATGQLRMRGQATPTSMTNEDSYLLLERDLLDQQIIDVYGRKVVRVNDVDLRWQAVERGTPLQVTQVEVGLRGATRRMLKGLKKSFKGRKGELDIMYVNNEQEWVLEAQRGFDSDSTLPSLQSCRCWACRTGSSWWNTAPTRRPRRSRPAARAGAFHRARRRR